MSPSRLHSKAEKRLKVVYGKDALKESWRINYTRQDGAIIAVGSGHSGPMALAQIRGMLADFAGAAEPVKKRAGR